MVKKFVICDLVAAVLILLEIFSLNFAMIKIGAVAYILLDALLVAIILFAVNLFANKICEGGNIQTCVINAVVIVLLYVLISGIYANTSFGVQSDKTLDQISVSESQGYSEDMDEGIEITFSDGDSSSQIINYGFYLAAAFVGGQLGIKIRKEGHEKTVTHKT